LFILVISTFFGFVGASSPCVVLHFSLLAQRKVERKERAFFIDPPSLAIGWTGKTVRTLQAATKEN
jgi:hypothetical protein